jgi:hypothetical protein
MTLTHRTAGYAVGRAQNTNVYQCNSLVNSMGKSPLRHLWSPRVIEQCSYFYETPLHHTHKGLPNGSSQSHMNTLYTPAQHVRGSRCSTSYLHLSKGAGLFTLRLPTTAHKFPIYPLRATRKPHLNILEYKKE